MLLFGMMVLIAHKRMTRFFRNDRPVGRRARARSPANIRNRVASVTFSVTALVKSPLGYDSAANVQTAIVVSKP